MNLANVLLKFNSHNFRGGSLQRRLHAMFVMFVVVILGGLAGLVLYELVEEVRGSSQDLQDRYHE